MNIISEIITQLISKLYTRENNTKVDNEDSESTKKETVKTGSGFVLGDRSLKNLIGVHPDLVKVVRKALHNSKQDFTVIDGVRTLERQKLLLAEGATRTLNSRHLTGHAVDIVPWVNNSISWDWKYFWAIEDAMKQAAKDLDIDLEWGGDWKSFKDGPHWQLSWEEYPK